MKYSYSFLIIIGIISMLLLLERKADACGILRDKQLFNEVPMTELDEFPWIGRIYYKNRLTRDRQYRCNAVLIGKRHLVAPAHCVMQARGYKPESVLLGDSNFGNSDNEADCNGRGKCADVPKSYMISDVALHPNYDRKTNDNDLALIHLEEDVKYSDYIQPLCLPPDITYTTDYLGQYFPFAGFLNKFENPTQNEKIKSIAHIIPSGLLSEIFNRSIPATTTIPIAYVGDYSFLSGSVLMGIDVTNSKLNNFYLLGILSSGTFATKVKYVILTRIPAYVNWIRTNMELPYKSTMNRVQVFA